MKNLFRKRLAAVLVGCLAAPTSLLISAPPAGAINGIVNACAHGVVCVDVDTGGKDGRNHTQWVGSIHLYALAPLSKTEAWTENFYQARGGSNDAWFTVNRWIHSGNNVCGAGTISGTNIRRIACITIRV